MHAYQKIKLVFSVVCAICLLPILHAQAQTHVEEWIDIPVVVNVIGTSDSSNVDEAVRKANEILAGAHIRLIVIKTIADVQIGNGDESLDETERKEAKEYGRQELANICGAGKGIKITVADDVWEEEPGVRGWTVLRKPVVFVEPDEPNTMGNVTAHVIGHSLGIEDHHPDPNNIMYESIPRGSDWDPNDVNEILGNATHGYGWHMSIFKPANMVKLVLGQPDWLLDPDDGLLFRRLLVLSDLAGKTVTLKGLAAKLDDFYDPNIVSDPCAMIAGPNTPSVQYADLRRILLYCDNPFDPNGETHLEIELGGPWPDTFDANSFFDVFVSEPNDNPVGRFHIEIGTNIGESGYWEDYNTAEIVTLDTQLLADFVIDGLESDVDGHRIVATGQIGLTDFTGPGDAESFKIWVESTTKDYRVPGQPPIIIEDFTEPFEYSLAQTWIGPSMGFVPWGVAGWAFGSDKEIGIELDSEAIGTTTTKSDGSFIWFMDPELDLEAGRHAVIVKELDDSGPTGAAHIRLIVIKTIYNVQIGDGDECLIGNERTIAEDYAQQELADICGAGKGIKITLADDVWGEDPNVRGWCLHGIPLVFVEPDEPNTMGNVTAHVIGHSLGIKEHHPDLNNIMYESIPRGISWDPNDVNEIFPYARLRGMDVVYAHATKDSHIGLGLNINTNLGGIVDAPVLPSFGFDFTMDWGLLDTDPMAGRMSFGGMPNVALRSVGLDLGRFISDIDDFYDQDINDPYGVITGPNDPCIAYTDLRETTMFCENPFDPNAETRFEIELGGNRPNDFDANLFFDVFVSEPNDAPVGVFHVNVPASDLPTAIWDDLRSGETFTVAVWITSDIAAADHGIFSWRSPSGRECINLRHQWGQTLESLKVHIESTIKEYRFLGEEPIIMQDSAGPFECGVTLPRLSPSIFLIPSGISGCGFDPYEEVGIELDSELIGSATTNADGSFIWFMDPEFELEVGTHAVIVKELDDSGPAGAAYATGYFKYCPEGAVASDFDNDCDIDFHDFAIFADDWLKGTASP